MVQIETLISVWQTSCRMTKGTAEFTTWSISKYHQNKLDILPLINQNEFMTRKFVPATQHKLGTV